MDKLTRARRSSTTKERSTDEPPEPPLPTLSTLSTSSSSQMSEMMEAVVEHKASMDGEEVKKEGWLAKKSTTREHDSSMITGNKRFIERYFQLTTTLLKYYEKEPSSPEDAPSAVMPLVNISLVAEYNYDVGEDAGKRFMVRGDRRRTPRLLSKSSSPIAHEEVDLNLKAKTKEQASEWFAAINAQLIEAKRASAELCNIAWSAMGTYLAQNSTVQQEYKRFEEDQEYRNQLPEGALCLAAPHVHIPPMNILILVVGTRGDLAPFTALGLHLASMGHRVRIGTHAIYRKDVVDAGLEFYPLGGDPKKLSSFMVKTEGRLIPNLLNREERQELPEKVAMLDEIIKTVWPAATAADPEAPEKGRFIADAIISNPVSYAHIHCAEALGVPLHLMFPQPWTPTKAFPHPFAGLPYTRGWAKQNWTSYYAVDEFFWAGVKPYINDARVRQMGVDPIRTGELGAFITIDNYVPWTFMWSPALVPKPKDWGEHVDVAGNFFIPVDRAVSDYKPPAEVAEWLAAGPAPIFVGFGSMVIADTSRLTKMIVDAAVSTGARVLIQSSWSELKGDAANPLPANVSTIGNCPHDWLFPQMAAVVHHGGAGTVAAGLKYGKPTMICPFFGDQHFWGQMVCDRGCGPRPIPIVDLTTEDLAKGLEMLLTPECKAAAEEMGRKFNEEDGVKAGAASFLRHLPLEYMVCQVSLFTDTPRLARVRCSTCNMLMSLEAAQAVHVGPMENHKLDTHRFADLGPRGPSNLREGMVEGGSTLVHEVVGGLVGLVKDPIVGHQEEGLKGLAKGIGTGLFNVIRRPVRGLVLAGDKVVTGQYNNLMLQRSGHSKDALMHKKRFLSDFSRFSTWAEEVHDALASTLFGDTMEERPVKAGNVLKHRAATMEPVPDAITTQLRAAHSRCASARKAFSSISGGKDFVNRSDVSQLVAKAASSVGIQQDTIDAVLLELDVGHGIISFPDYCTFVTMVEGPTVVSDKAEAAAAAADTAAVKLAAEATAADVIHSGGTTPVGSVFEGAFSAQDDTTAANGKAAAAAAAEMDGSVKTDEGNEQAAFGAVDAPTDDETPEVMPPRGIIRGRSEMLALQKRLGEVSNEARQQAVHELMADMYKTRSTSTASVGKVPGGAEAPVAQAVA